LTNLKEGGKRLVDTGVLIAEFVLNPFDEERHARAVARMNWLHKHYKIENEDLLYTLSVYVSEPERWIRKYDWRSMTELEFTVSSL